MERPYSHKPGFSSLDTTGFNITRSYTYSAWIEIEAE